MPNLPPGLAEWLGLLVQPAAILGGGALFVNQLNKRIDDLRSDMKDGMVRLEARQDAMRAEQREENKAMRAEQREENKAMRAEQREQNRALNEKLDRLLESRMAATN